MQTKHENVKLICDYEDNRIIPIEILNFNEYEKEELEMLKKIMDDDTVIFDIGANIGYYSRVFSKYKPNSKRYAFEPIPKTFNYLNENIKINNVDNIITNNIALSNYNGNTKFYYYSEVSGTASMKQLNSDVENQIIECEVRKLDDFIDNETKVDLIKCDTEGSELFVFQGAKETIIKNKPIIFTEMLRKWSEKFEYHPNDMIKFFSEIGYKCYIMKENYIEEFLEMIDETVETNFLFLHEEKHSKYIEKYIK